MTTKPDDLAEFEASLIGRSCVVGGWEHGWSFDLMDGFRLMIQVPWRIISEGRIAFGSDDDGQWFGLTSPVDGEAEARRLLGNKLIRKVVLDRQTADLTLQFDSATRVDVFNQSRGYEGWQATYNGGWLLVAKGGGDVAVFPPG